MNNAFQDVVDFHKKFGIDYAGPPRQLDAELEAFRTARMMEELKEYSDAKTLADKQDALVDLVYVALGTAHVHGMNQFPIGWWRVHMANMMKERVASAADSRFGHSHDIIKPPGWIAPYHHDLVGELPAK